MKTPKKKVPAKKKLNSTYTLYKAVSAYIKANGGTAIVVGGIQIIQWPNDGGFKYTVGVRVTGKRPVFEKPEAQ